MSVLIKKYLESLVVAVNDPTAQYILDSGAPFVGSEFDPKEWPAAQRTPKACFENAGRLAIDHDLTYVEGYAMSVIPIHHGWCVTDDGRVVDPTWDDTAGVEYFGVGYDTTWLASWLVRTGTWGVFYKPGTMALFETAS